MDDPKLGQPGAYDWSMLTRPPGEQQHWTARQFMNSYRAEAGWVEFERL